MARMRAARIAIGLAALAFGGAIGVRGLAAQQQRQVFVSVVDSRGVPVFGSRAPTRSRSSKTRCPPGRSRLSPSSGR